ncbi:hypothetical protein [Dysgonomonas sp. ZJ709]|uniref:hypothetical protein n=1 Tax=Dysgonomonas sp. ZJ709 TaxID=2709797 RepID=UPI0013ECB196|nr:hypothetical protein [Dysgonomonas sp. ZJ709]
MKKLFFSLFSAAMLLSCSSNSEDELVPDGGNQKSYPVTLNISGFKLESTPLKSFDPGSETMPITNYCQYIIYKADGSVLMSERIIPDIKNIDNNEITITEELPAGTYTIAVLSAPYAPIPGEPLSFHTHIIPSNFNTDYCGDNSSITGLKNNTNIFFETVGCTVDSNSGANTSMDIVLKPMWSLMDINVTDADKCYLPTGTTHILLSVTPLTSGFYLKTKKSYYNHYPHALDLIVPVSEFRANNGFANIPISQTNNATVTLWYMDSPMYGNMLGEKVLYKGDIENAKYTTLVGEIGSEKSQGQSFGITVAKLETVEIPFAE